MEEVKENKKVFILVYHFTVFAIVNELLIIKNRRISPVYWLMQARDEMRLLSIEIARGELFTSSNGYTQVTLNPRSELR